MLVEIRLEGLEFFARHGFYQEEQALGNRYTVNIAMKAEAGAAVLKGDLSATVDYGKVYKSVRTVMAAPAKLLETLAAGIGAEILSNHPSVRQVTVEVRKYQPPLGGICHYSSVAVTLPQ